MKPRTGHLVVSVVAVALILIVVIGSLLGWG